MSRFQELTRRAAVRALGSAGCQPAIAGNILASAIVLISDPVLGKLPRPTGWQPMLPRIRIGVHAESVKSRQRTRSVDHMLRVNSEFLHHFRAGCAQAEAVQADDFSVEANVLIPNFGDAGFDRNTFPTC